VMAWIIGAFVFKDEEPASLSRQFSTTYQPQVQNKTHAIHNTPSKSQAFKTGKVYRKLKDCHGGLCHFRAIHKLILTYAVSRLKQLGLGTWQACGISV